MSYESVNFKTMRYWRFFKKWFVEGRAGIRWNPYAFGPLSLEIGQKVAWRAPQHPLKLPHIMFSHFDLKGLRIAILHNAKKIAKKNWVKIKNKCVHFMINMIINNIYSTRMCHQMYLLYIIIQNILFFMIEQFHNYYYSLQFFWKNILNNK